MDQNSGTPAEGTLQQVAGALLWTAVSPLILHCLFVALAVLSWCCCLNLGRPLASARVPLPAQYPGSDPQTVSEVTVFPFCQQSVLCSLMLRVLKRLFHFCIYRAVFQDRLVHTISPPQPEIIKLLLLVFFPSIRCLCINKYVHLLFFP